MRVDGMGLVLVSMSLSNGKGLTVHGLSNRIVCARDSGSPVKVLALTYLASLPVKADMICEFADSKLV